jgi:multicomponent Na+:H+ antiporter subunit D
VIVPLVVAIPFAGAAAITIVGKLVPNRVVDVVGIATALAATVLAALLVERSAHRVVYWFGGWKPRPGQFPLGISFSVDRLGAGLACLALALVSVALLYSWRYLEEEHHLYHVLMLLFAGGLAGFALSGDLFNMFVFFELMSVSAYALTAYRVEEMPSLQAAFNFAVSNSVGSFLVLFGIALLYGRTGALNLAELGQRVGTRRDALVAVALALLVCGFLVKAAIVPFHFWLADAYAAAPAPVCLLFAAVMSELGLYAVARVYWTVFSSSVHHELRVVLLVLGVASALLGAVMCVLQRHLKRLLAFATISDLGCTLIGIALLTRDGLAGAALTVLVHGLAKGALFLACGVLLVVLGEVDELLLYGRGRALPLVGVAWLLATIALAANFPGHALIGEAGPSWAAPVLAVATIVSTGAIVRAGARVFLGVGTRADPLLTEEPRESPGPREHPSIALMTGLTLLLAVAALGASASTGLATAVQDAAGVFTRTGAAAVGWQPMGSSIVWAAVTLAGTFAWGALGLLRGRLPQAAEGLGRPFRALHSGDVCDYVAWLTFGTALIGGVFIATVR